jgi:tRNA pseudouridine32 synthase/23S rRNA pseudouridine746 synthase
MPLRWLHVDDQLIVVDKPAGLLSVPGRGAQRQDCVAARVQASHPDALVVHRLDQATSGLLLMARGLAAQRVLGAAFEARQIDKRYVAVVAGLVADDEGCVDLPLAADWPNRPLQKVDPVQGRPAVTHYRVLARDPLASTTRLALMPVTGRSHQLRVHLQARGHPILGDALYAPAPVQALAARLLLHASAIGLQHPASGAPLWFEAPAAF